MSDSMVGTNIILHNEYSDNYVGEARLGGNGRPEDVGTLADLELFVADAETDRPISKAMISIDSIGRTAVCDSQGRVTINEIQSREFMLDVIFPGYSALSMKVHLSGLHHHRLKVVMQRNC